MKDRKLFRYVLMVMIVLTMFATASISVAEILHTDEGVIITHYPKSFDKVGTLDGIDDKGLVIDDIFFPFSGSIRYMSPRLRFATRSHFEKGKSVGIVLDENEKVAILCLMYSK